jgi:hypothetical protein
MLDKIMKTWDVRGLDMSFFNTLVVGKPCVAHMVSEILGN